MNEVQINKIKKRADEYATSCFPYEKQFLEREAVVKCCVHVVTETIADLEAQIEKMKCCGNCKNEGDYKEPYRYGTGWCNICKRHKVAKGNFDK